MFHIILLIFAQSPLCILCQDGQAFLRNENSARLYQKQYENTISIVQWGLKIAAYPICLCIICSYTSMAFKRQNKCFVTAGSLIVTSEVCGKLYCMKVFFFFPGTNRQNEGLCREIWAKNWWEDRYHWGKEAKTVCYIKIIYIFYFNYLMRFFDCPNVWHLQYWLAGTACGV